MSSVVATDMLAVTDVRPWAQILGLCPGTTR